MISTTKAEYVALSEVVTTLKFIVMVLQSMEIEVTLTITIFVDNIGAVFLANNRTIQVIEQNTWIFVTISFMNILLNWRKMVQMC